MLNRLAAYDYRALPAPVSSTELAAYWRPYMETSIERFGADRCMFESNFPVEKMGISWAVLWNAFKRIAAGASAACFSFRRISAEISSSGRLGRLGYSVFDFIVFRASEHRGAERHPVR